MANKFYQWQKFLSRFGLWKSEKISVIVDDNPDLGYEKKSRFYFFMIPIIWLLVLWVAIKKKILGPNLKINTFWFDGASRICRQVKENAATWRALDIIYNYSPGKDKSFDGRITDFWNNLLSVRATRNRLRLLKYYLKKEIQNCFINYSEVRLISIASGSAQGVIEVIEEFKEKSIKAIFLDLDPTAIEHSKKLAEGRGIKDKIIFINRSARDLEEVARGFQPHIVEVVGFLMYRPKEKAIKLIERIHRILAPSGILLVSQDNHILEKFFLYYVVNWPLIFRSPEKFAELLIKGGFNPKHCKIIYEPLKMHGLAICRKII